LGSGLISLVVYLLGWEKYATILPLSVLEGFSFAVGCTIGLSQLVNAFGLDKACLPKHREFYLNVYEVFIRAGDLVWADFSVFLVLFIALMWLSKYRPGKPWIVLIAIIGVIYGWVMTTWVESFKPKLLGDLYPTLTKLDQS
jgi:MFS superfamily sulfate permease-like transporter